MAYRRNKINSSRPKSLAQGGVNRLDATPRLGRNTLLPENSLDATASRDLRLRRKASFSRCADPGSSHPATSTTLSAPLGSEVMFCCTISDSLSPYDSFSAMMAAVPSSGESPPSAGNGDSATNIVIKPSTTSPTVSTISVSFSIVVVRL